MSRRAFCHIAAAALLAAITADDEEEPEPERSAANEPQEAPTAHDLQGGTHE